MDLDVSQRELLTCDLLSHLSAAVPGSEALLRGSLAAGRADPYSDIDLIWDVPDRAFAQSLSQLPEILAAIGPIASLRFDPDFQTSLRRRLVLIRFTGVPLFWRVDLDVFARSVGRNPDFDRDNPLARGKDWSYAESSLANAVAAIKAYLRGQDDDAAALLERAELRIGLSVYSVDLRSRIVRLTDHVAKLEPEQRQLSMAVVHLTNLAFSARAAGEPAL